MTARLAYCNEGCNNQFYVSKFQTEKLPGAIEKTYFSCTHCGHEYVSFYTDVETRKLQEQMRKLHKRFADPTEHKGKLIKQEGKLQRKIKRKMKAVRERVESIA